jgi:O-antigen chain-terminating methyltransferase
MGEHLRSIHRQTEKTGTDVDNLRVEFQRAKATAEAAQKIVETQIDQAALHLGDLQAQTGAHGTHLQNLQALTGEHGTHLKNLQALTDHHGTHLQNLQAQTDDYGTHLQNLQAQTDDHGAHLQNLQAQTDHHGTHLQNLQTQTDDHGTHLNNLEGESANIRSSLKELCKTLQGQIDSAAVHLGNLQGVSEALGVHLRGLQTQADGLGVHLRNLQAQSDGFEVNLDKLQGFVDKHAAETSASLGGFEQHLKDQADLPQKISNIEERNTIESAFVKGELSEYGSLFRRLLGDDLKEGTPARGKGRRPNGPEAKATRRFDSFYLSFENRFRGSREEIKKRVSFYLPFLQKARAGASARPILDLGCGRGEWLELLKDHKLKGRGVDMNSTMTAHCQARGLTVLQGDAIEFLRTLRSNSQGGITGFHIIEHLPFETVMELFRESRRVLKPGGIAIFESPNCKNLTVGACNFYVDPTHRNPVFPETAEFMLASHGFENIKIEYLSPVANPPFEATSAEFATIKDLLYGPQDFGIIAYKSKKR